MNEYIHEIQKIKNQILTENPNNVKDFVELFLGMYKNDGNVDLNSFISVIREMKLKVFIANVGYEVDNSGLKTLLERRISEIEFQRDIERASSKYPNFPQSEAYIYIKQFARKYENNGSYEELSKLRLLLKNRGWDLSLGELVFFVGEENNTQRSDNTKSKILINNPQSREEILKSYLNYFQSNDIEMLRVLAEILIEKKLPFEGIGLLKSELEAIEKEIEIENFEKRLAEENEQIWIEDIDQLNGYEFEEFLKNLFIKMGYQVIKMGYQVEQTKLSGDQGADLVVVKFGEKTVIQAKCYSGKVGNYAVQEIFAAMNLYKAQKGMVVTNNYFTPAAFELADANNIELVDRNALEELINKHW